MTKIKNKFNLSFSEIVIILATILLIVGILFNYCQEWNNGVCPNCETKYEFITCYCDRDGNVVDVYKCPVCGKVIKK